MIPNKEYEPTLASGNMKSSQAQILMTDNMFEILSSGIYKDKILAVIREIICNARDAHVMNGNTRAIEVHVPTSLSPYFSVRDFGPGLNEEQAHHLYLTYGDSTKRGDNLGIGGLGIGSKSPLAYSDSFIVESTQNGVTATYGIAKKNGIPTINNMGRKATTEADGLMVKVSVGQRDVEEFKQKTGAFLRYFTYDVKTQGGAISRNVTKILETPLYTTYEGGYNHKGQLKAIMGGVVYDIRSELAEPIKDIIGNDMMILQFQIGDLAFQASREALSQDADTDQVIKDVVDKVESEFLVDFQTKINSEPTVYALFKMLRRFKLFQRNSNWGANSGTRKRIAKLKYKGKGALTYIDDYDHQKFELVIDRGYNRKKTQTLTAIEELPTFLRKDRINGYKKTAEKLSQAAGTSRWVMIVETDAEEDVLKEFFGSHIKILKVSEEYERLVPKEERAKSVSVARSGLFTSREKEITKLDKTQTGWYIPFERHTCVIKGARTGFNRAWDSVKAIAQALVDTNILKEDELYLCRKGGLAAVKKTEIKEMKFSDLLDLLRVDLTPDLERAFVVKAAHRSIGAMLTDKKLAGTSNVLYTLEPAHKEFQLAKSLGAGSKSLSALSVTGMRVAEFVVPSYHSVVNGLVDQMRSERKRLEQEYPLPFHLNSYGLPMDIDQDLIGYIGYKLTLNNGKNDDNSTI